MIERPLSKPQAIARTLRYREAQEHLLRRLGQAVVLQWDALPDDLQDLLLDQAALVDDRTDAPHGADEIALFVRNVKAMSLPAAPAVQDAQ